MWQGTLQKIDNYRYEIPKTYKQGMKTSGIIYANQEMMNTLKNDNAPEQVANVTFLPGILGKSLAMPDIHWGYGFPIGGVAGLDDENGVLSPGGVGYDINCGVRLVRTNLTLKDVQPKIKELIDEIFVNVPSGVGSEGKIKVSMQELDLVLKEGAKWGVEKGYGWQKDLEYLEENGFMKNALPEKVSFRAKQRGTPQIGSLGAGNHFLEVQKVEEIYDYEIAKILGITQKEQIMVMIHTGSRGLGYQIAEDYIEVMNNAVRKYNIQLPDRQLCCAPTNSKESEDYFKAMQCGANYAWANRQLIVHWVREAFEKVFKRKAEEMDMNIVYDVAHNIAKLEEHIINGKRQKIYVHRKGATRSFGKNREEVPLKYREIGQPVLIPGDMGRESYVLVGTEKAMEETFGSTCHGAGRVMSRNEAMRRFTPEGIRRELALKGIYVREASKNVLTEEAPSAYKNVANVVDVCHGAGISKKVVRLKPLGVMKG